MQKPTAVIAAVLAVSLPVVVATSSFAADPSSTTPTSTSPTSTSTTPTSPYTPEATPTPAAAPAAPLPNPAPTLAALQSSAVQGLTGYKYKALLAGKGTITIATPAAGTYVVTIAYRKPGKKYRSVGKGAVSIAKAGTTTPITIKPNSYAASTARYAKHLKKIKLQVTVSYELSNRTVVNEQTITIKP